MICGSSGASDTAKVRVLASRGPLSPTLTGVVFDELCSHEYPSAGVKCQGTCAPRLFHADVVALLPALARGLQYFLISLQSPCDPVPESQVSQFISCMPTIHF